MVDDIIIQNSQAILLLESPHTEEIKAGHPLAGSSGLGVSQVLFGETLPFGQICRSFSYRMSVLNTFQHPMQHKEHKEHKEQGNTEFLGQMNNIEYPKDGKGDEHYRYKKELKNVLESYRDANELQSYKSRVVNALSRSSSPRIVVAGLIAQTVFEYVFNQSATIRYATPYCCAIEEKCLKVFFICHPSSRASGGVRSAWLARSNSSAVNKLKVFLGLSNRTH